MVSNLTAITPSINIATASDESARRDFQILKSSKIRKESPTLANERSNDKNAENPVFSRRSDLPDGSVFRTPTEKTFMKLWPKDSGRCAS
jgi:hypothetical protein